MSEAPAAVSAPGGGGDAPAPAPAPAPTPTAPVAAPGTTPAPTPAPAPSTPTPSPEEAAAQAADEEWDNAQDEIFPGLKSTQKKEPKDESTKPKTSTEETTAPPANPENQEPNAEPKPGDGTEAPSEEAKPTPDSAAALRDARAATRQIAEQEQQMVADVRTQLYPDLPEQLVDQGGDPINTVQDVMQLINPDTGQVFTQEEAERWLPAAQQQFKERRAELDAQIQHIADVNLEVKDGADAINAEFGEWLKAHTEKRDEIWTEYQRSLKIDPTTKTILEAPVSIEWFYRQALKPLMDAEKAAPTVTAETTTAPGQPEPTPEQKAQADADAKADLAKKKQQERADRSDVYTPGNTDVTSDEDKEWAKAEEAVFGRKVNK